jgi:hypothetical protein
VSEPSEDPPAEQGADDGPALEGHHEEARGASGLGCAAAGAAAAVEDEGDLERKPHDVEPLKRPGDEEGREGVGEDERPAGEAGEHGRDEQDAFVPEHVAELGEDRHDQRGQQQLGGLEPVEVRVPHVQVFHEVADERNVVTLQDPADDLHQEEVADQAERDRARLRAHGCHLRMLPADRASAAEAVMTFAVPDSRRPILSRLGG